MHELATSRPNEDVFTNLAIAQGAAVYWLVDFSDVRPHQSLRYRTPSEYASTFTEAIISHYPRA